MNDHVFVLLEDPAAPSRADVLAAVQNNTQGADVRMSSQVTHPPHYRTTFLTLRPPGALEQLLSQLKARWIPVRQSSTSSSQRGQTSAQQLSVEGLVFAIGNDWLVRVGNVILAGGAVKGMLLEVGGPSSKPIAVYSRRYVGRISPTPGPSLAGRRRYI